MSSPIPAACWSPCRSMELTSKTVTARLWYWLRYTFPKLRHVFPDSSYTGPKLAAALKPLGR